MPDMHEGYGFPVGGVAATAAARRGDLAGRHRLRHQLRRAPAGLRPAARATWPARIEALVHELSRSVPAGMGRGRAAGALDRRRARPRADRGRAPTWCANKGLGLPEDLDFIESGGALPGADAAAVSDRAKQRGARPAGHPGQRQPLPRGCRWSTRSSTPAAAAAFGLEAEQIVVLIHSGSRGLGHQVCTDYVRRMDRAAGRYGITLPDRQLACAPLSSPEGERATSPPWRRRPTSASATAR